MKKIFLAFHRWGLNSHNLQKGGSGPKLSCVRLQAHRRLPRASSDPEPQGGTNLRPVKASSRQSVPDVLYTRPTLDQIEEALSAVAIDTPEEAQRARDAKTWADILRK